MVITRTKALALAASLTLGGFLAFGPTTGATNIGNQGCTPGYWNNHTKNWEEYTPATKVGDVFALPDSLAAYRDLTLLQALQGGGGSGIDGATKILLRASTAAFLNAAHEGLGYPMRRFSDPGNLSSRINAALASGDRDAMLTLAAELDRANNLGCPLN